jgi:hypothetical protein
VRAPGGKPAGGKAEPAYTTTFYPNAIDLSGASVLDVGMGAEIPGIEIRMAKIDTFRVAGRVAGISQGQRAEISLSPSGVGKLMGSSSTEAQPDGSFEIRGVAPGTYTLGASVTEMSGLTMGAGITQAVQVTDRHVEGIVLDAGANGNLSGVLTVEGKNPMDLRTMQVVLDPVETMFGGPMAPLLEGGKFTLKNVAPVRYVVRVTTLPESAYVRSVRLGTTGGNEDEIDLSGSVAGLLQITVSQAGGQLDGVVRNGEGNAVGGATVALIPASKRSSLYKGVTSDQSGGYSIKGIAPGDYTVLAWEEIETSAYQDPEFVKPFESKAEAVSFKENDRKALSLKATPAAK